MASGAGDFDVGRIVLLCDLFSEPTRVRIVRFLIDRGEADAGSIGEALGKDRLSISPHLTRLRVAGVIDYRGEGKYHIYSVVDPEGLAATMAGLFGPPV